MSDYNGQAEEELEEYVEEEDYAEDSAPISLEPPPLEDPTDSAAQQQQTDDSSGRPAAAVAAAGAEGEDDDEDPEIAEMKRKLAELEEENNKIAALSASAHPPAGAPSAAASAASAEVDARSVYIGNVDYSSTKEELHSLFSACGAVNRVTLPTDFRGNPKGFAYVEFAERESVATAAMLSETEFKGRQITVIPKRTNVPAYQLRGGAAGGRGGSRGRGRGRGGGRRGGGGGGGGGRGGGIVEGRMVGADMRLCEAEEGIEAGLRLTRRIEHRRAYTFIVAFAA